MSDKFIRSPMNPGAVLNTDTEALMAYKRQKAKFKEMNDTMERQKKLESEVSEIKDALHQIKKALGIE